MNSKGHNTDIGHIIYGFHSWKELHKNASEEILNSYYIFTDALMISIDHTTEKRDSHKYEQLALNIRKATKSIAMLPPLKNISAPGGAAHRKYCHQGFIINDDIPEYSRTIWTNRRDSILIPSVCIAFNMKPDDPRATIIAIIGYYIHMLGDLYKGETQFMNGIRTYSQMFRKFASDLAEYEAKLQYQYTSLNQLINKLNAAANHRELTRSFEGNSFRTAMYGYTKSYLSKTIPDVIAEMMS